jgi:hypothetical protein
MNPTFNLYSDPPPQGHVPGCLRFIPPIRRADGGPARGGDAQVGARLARLADHDQGLSHLTVSASGMRMCLRVGRHLCSHVSVSVQRNRSAMALFRFRAPRCRLIRPDRCHVIPDSRHGPG